jgi:hypothetical protein
VQLLAQKQPELVHEYLQALFTRGVQPKEASQYTKEAGSNEHLAGVAKMVGAADEVWREILGMQASDEVVRAMYQEADALRHEHVIKFTPTTKLNDVTLDPEEIFTSLRS